MGMAENKIRERKGLKPEPYPASYYMD
jgi:hypothetical protein